MHSTRDYLLVKYLSPFDVETNIRSYGSRFHTISFSALRSYCAVFFPILVTRLKYSERGVLLTLQTFVWARYAKFVGTI